MAEEASARRWITCTGLGCAGLLMLAMLAAGGLLGDAWLDARNERRAERSLRPTLPPTAGRVEIDISGAEVQMRAAAPGESLRIEADFDERIYRLEESLDRESTPWSYRLKLAGDVSPTKTLLRRIVGGKGARVDLFLPTGAPLELSIRGMQSAFTIDLADLWLTTAECEFSQGGVMFEASRPTAAPLDALTLHGSMGAFRLVNLGNASPRRLLVDTKMSGLHVDLLGEWRNDASVTLRSNQGGATLKLAPQVVAVGLEGGAMRPLGGAELPAPVLTFTVAADEIEVVE